MSAFLIERTDGAIPMFLSEKIGRDFAAGRFGGWTHERAKATTYEQEEAQAIVDGPIGHIAPFCKVVEK